MAHVCPVCKARLWKRPFSRRLRCPRCGAEFRATVPLAYFQLLFFLFLLLALSVVVSLSYRYAWLVLLLLALFAFIVWFLPRVVRLELDSASLRVAEGPMNDELSVKVRYRGWVDNSEGEEEGADTRVRSFLLLLAALIIFLVGLILLQVFS